jgi:hypothetical protein
MKSLTEIIFERLLRAQCIHVDRRLFSYVYAGSVLANSEQIRRDYAWAHGRQFLPSFG